MNTKPTPNYFDHQWVDIKKAILSSRYVHIGKNISVLTLVSEDTLEQITIICWN